MGTTTTTRSSGKAKTPAKAAPGAPSARSLKLSPEVFWYLQDRGIPLPDCPPMHKTPEPRYAPGAMFDPARVDRILSVFNQLRHVAGKWAGTPLRPDPWQIAYILAPTFGWVRWDKDADAYTRIIRDLYVDVPRKNGKSTLAAGIAIYMACADGEQGAQVVTAATNEKQAGYVFNPIKTLAAKAPKLRGHVRAYTKKVLHPRSGSYIEVISSVADAQHGANIHCSIVDELHVHKDGDLLSTLETGRGSRTQPLSVIITTADSGKPDTVYDKKRRYIERLAKRTIKDESVYGVVWAAPKTANPFSEETMKRANPGYGVSPSRAYMKAEARKAENSPADLAQFLRLHLGIRTKQDTRYIDLAAWDANGGIIHEEELHGELAYGGLDLGSVSDLTAFAMVIPREDGLFKVLWRFWVPEDSMEALDQRTAGSAAVWKREGWLQTTPGNVTDYDYVKKQILKDAEDFDLHSIAFDRWNASQLSVDLEQEGVEMLRVGQGYASQSAPLKEIQRYVLQGLGDGKPVFDHGGNPVMRWMTDNLAVTRDAAGNVKPNKAVAAEKIDGWSAVVNAMSEAMKADPPKKSSYEDEGLRAVGR